MKMKFEELEKHYSQLVDATELNGSDDLAKQQAKAPLKFITVKGCKPETHRKLRTVAAALDVPMPYALDFCVSAGLVAVVEQLNSSDNNKGKGMIPRRISEQPS
jgi:hypothetical protein